MFSHLKILEGRSQDETIKIQKRSVAKMIKKLYELRPPELQSSTGEMNDKKAVKEILIMSVNRETIKV